MHAAKIADSPRLQRVLAVLQDSTALSTSDIIERAHVCAVNSCIAEMRAAPNNLDIDCKCVGRGRFVYRLLQPQRQKRMFA